MPRNKYPEQTVDRILQTSQFLFLEKGYENTSIQDILYKLGDLTKGAVYHHFKSKEDIFNAVAEKMSQSLNEKFNEIKERQDLKAAEKLKELVKVNIFNSSTQELIQISPSFLDNPKFLSFQMKEIQSTLLSQDFLPVIEEGVKDGSILTENPLELAELILICLSLWLNPLVFGQERQRRTEKCKFINQMLSQYKIELFDDEMIKQLASL
ncbi:MAG: TetR/AcrR family transcriptional regulator [Lactovum sp.]